MSKENPKALHPGDHLCHCCVNTTFPKKILCAEKNTLKLQQAKGHSE